MLLEKLASPYKASVLLEFSRAFQREKHEMGAQWFVSTNGEEGFFHTPYPFPCHLFRGQSAHFEPCLPSVSRGLERYAGSIGEMTLSDQAKVVIRIAKSHWFVHEIRKHPAVKWAKNNQYSVNEIGIAQHYELETGFIDVSHNFDVAAFFATCVFKDGVWKPQSEGIGVVYFFDISKAQRCAFRAEPVSLQPLPRPTEQGAWLVEIPFGADFETHPAVSWIKFAHDESVSKHYLELFDGGSKLFPKDPINKVAERIKNSSQISESFIRNIVSQWTKIDGGIDDPESLLLEVRRQIGIEEKKESFLDEKDLKFMKKQWEDKVKNFGKNCITIPIAFQILAPIETKEKLHNKSLEGNGGQAAEELENGA